jgi:predicted nucleotidyltransferase component of viral defense system
VSGKGEKINFRTEVQRAAADANVKVNEYERALILGQIALLLTSHPGIGRRIAFKGGAIMTLIDGSPRLSRDLDGVMVAGGRIDERIVLEALTNTAQARKIVIRVDRFVTTGKDSLHIPVIVCHPLSGKGEVSVSLSIKWNDPLLLEPEQREVSILGREVTLPIMQRIERVSEKIRAFLDRGEDRDAFDLYHFSVRGLRISEWNQLLDLVVRKIGVDEEFSRGTDLLGQFDENIRDLAMSWATKGGLVVMRETPTWDEVYPHILNFRPYVPETKQ